MADYSVGYGKPPKETQFVKGKSGNPRGRRRGTQNIATIFVRIGTEKISVKENGRTKTMTRLEAVLRQLNNKALSGDLRAGNLFVSWYQTFEASTEAISSKPEVGERDKAALQNILKRMQRLGSASAIAEKEAE